MSSPTMQTEVRKNDKKRSRNLRLFENKNFFILHCLEIPYCMHMFSRQRAKKERRKKEEEEKLKTFSTSCCEFCAVFKVRLHEDHSRHAHTCIVCLCVYSVSILSD